MDKLNLQLGTDVVYLPRFKDKIDNYKFINKVLTFKEREIYESITHERLQLEFLAGRFACKEAYSKAIKTGIGELDFKDVEILRDDKGAPISDQGTFSISHDRDYLFVVVLV